MVFFYPYQQILDKDGGGNDKRSSLQFLNINCHRKKIIVKASE